MKIAIAQISTDPGNIAVNSKKIINYIKKAQEMKADIIIFPELAIPGYMSLDLMLYQKFVAENLKALQQISEHTKNILAVVGFIDQDKGKIGPDGTPIRYNSAAIIRNQKIIAVQDKTLLPNYDVFFENRYFSTGRGRKIVEFKGINLGMQICEDLWDENYPIKVSEDLVNMGADILINISGSPFYMGKRRERQNLIQQAVFKYKVPFIYVNTVGTQDGYDGELVFDGQSMVFSKKGKLISLGSKFEDDIFLFDYESLFGKDEKINVTDNPIEDLYLALTKALKDYFQRNKFSKAFIGISGGIDSAVVAVLARNALGKENITGLCLQTKFTSEQSIQDSETLTKNLNIKLEKISVKNIYESILETLQPYFERLAFDSTEENIQARIRGLILMAFANKFNALVISTANKTETALGYTTLYGDMCGAIAPLADVSKENVYKLANFINEKEQLIPQTILDKIPSAELRQNQSDEQALGAGYDIVSPLVDELIENLTTRNSLEKKYNKEMAIHMSELISRNEYKRRQAAPAVKVTKKAFGLGRRMPISHKFKN